MKLLSAAVEAILRIIRPDGVLPPERIDEIVRTQEAASKESDRLASSLERVARDNEDPFEAFATRARNAQWRRTH